jgi:hypothetical protein
MPLLKDSRGVRFGVLLRPAINGLLLDGVPERCLAKDDGDWNGKGLAGSFRAGVPPLAPGDWNTEELSAAPPASFSMYSLIILKASVWLACGEAFAGSNS